ncbi:hypothetical protein PT974_11323 [Cladobotryum mycophilum]|uniref:Uncharacterized protein n=1 Tax=Cladobotryum mycophilum TaxID=491253 RepID=A0ABR0S4W9_9HYPO
MLGKKVGGAENVLTKTIGGTGGFLRTAVKTTGNMLGKTAGGVENDVESNVLLTTVDAAGNVLGKTPDVVSGARPGGDINLFAKLQSGASQGQQRPQGSIFLGNLII